MDLKSVSMIECVRTERLPLQDTLRFTPALEFEPHELGIEDFLQLQDSGTWPAKWEAALEVYSLVPLSPGSWMIDLASVYTDSALDLLIARAVRGKSRSELGPLTGGYAVGDVGLTLEPTCCCALSDLSDWESALDGSGCRLLIGHGCWSTELTDQTVTIELEPEAAGLEVSRLVLPLALLREAVDSANRTRSVFRDRLATRLRAVGVAEPENVADILAGTVEPSIRKS